MTFLFIKHLLFLTVDVSNAFQHRGVQLISTFGMRGKHIMQTLIVVVYREILFTSLLALIYPTVFSIHVRKTLIVLSRMHKIESMKWSVALMMLRVYMDN